MENKILKINEDLNNQKNNINNLQKDFKEDLNYYNKQNEENNLKLEKKIKDLKNEMKQRIKDNSHMTNNEFLMLLHLMRLKKETVYESNPYIVDFSVTLESVYQSESAEDEGDGDNYLFSRFENDLNKYVD